MGFVPALPGRYALFAYFLLAPKKTTMFKSRPVGATGQKESQGLGQIAPG